MCLVKFVLQSHEVLRFGSERRFVQRAHVLLTSSMCVRSMETSYRNVLRTVHICPAGYVHRKPQKGLISQGVSE